MRIVIETIPHDQQRYPTVGDWYRDEEGTLHIKVSEMSDNRHNFLVALHELIEVTLCEHRGITEESVSAFDIQYEKEREEGKHSDDEEPGFADNAPYRKEHTTAMSVEMLMAAELDVNWSKYDEEVMNL